MRDQWFEWDDAKAVRNSLDHHVTFEMAREVFTDIFAVEWADDGHDDAEQRFVIIGMVRNRLLFVSYAQRGERIRIISARLAEAYERRRHHNESRT